MNFPSYIYYELLIRLSELGADTGEYQSASVHNEICFLHTTKGTFSVPHTLLIKQFEDPRRITPDELQLLLSNFESNFL